MPNIAAAFKAEVSRVARKEIRAETTALTSASVRYRSDIAALKRGLAALRKELRQLARGTRLPAHSAEEAAPRDNHRFSAKGLSAQRKRLGLSAGAMGKLIGVSGLSIYHWEAGKARPRAKYMPAIAALKTLGKDEAEAVLATR